MECDRAATKDRTFHELLVLAAYGELLGDAKMKFVLPAITALILGTAVMTTSASAQPHCWWHGVNHCYPHHDWHHGYWSHGHYYYHWR